MNPKFRQLPPAIIGATMMTLLAERAGLLWGGARAAEMHTAVFVLFRVACNA